MMYSEICTILSFEKNPINVMKIQIEKSKLTYYSIKRKKMFAIKI
jgi:hypothetical protein